MEKYFVLVMGLLMILSIFIGNDNESNQSKK